MDFFLTAIHDLWNSVHSGNWPELGPWSYALLILLVATEGPLSTLLGAAAAATGILDVRYVLVSAFVGNVLGDCLWYTVGSISSLDRIHRYGRCLGIRKCHLEKLEQGMDAHATKLIIISKLAIGLIIPTLVAAGLARITWRRWLPLVLVVETVWTVLMVVVGFRATGLVGQMERGLQLLGMIVLLAGVIVVLRKYGPHFFQKERTAAVAKPATARRFKPQRLFDNSTTHVVQRSQLSRTLAVHTAKGASTALARTSQTLATQSQILRASTAVVAKPTNPRPVHFPGRRSSTVSAL